MYKNYTKIFATNEKELESLMKTIWIFIQNIGIAIWN